MLIPTTIRSGNFKLAFALSTVTSYVLLNADFWIKVQKNFRIKNGKTTTFKSQLLRTEYSLIEILRARQQPLLGYLGFFE